MDTSNRRGRLAPVVALLGAVLLLAPPAEAALGDYRCVNQTQVYLGNGRLFQRPCHVAADRVYQSIPEYQQILSKRLTDKDLEYHLLMKKAARKFADAIRKMARANDHDLVAEVGAVVVKKKGVPPVPNRTSEAIAAL